MQKYHAARYPFLYCQTTEEERFIRNYRTKIDKSLKFFRWDIVSGFRALMNPPDNENQWIWVKVGIQGVEEFNSTGDTSAIKLNIPAEQEDQVIKNPSIAIDHVPWLPSNTIIFMHDYHKFFDDIIVVRSALNIKNDLIANQKMIVFISAQTTIPIELSNDIKTFDFDLPAVKDLKKILEVMCSDNEIKIPKNSKMIVEAMRGLTEESAKGSIALSLATKSKIDYKVILDQKVSSINSSSVFTYIHPKETKKDIAGNERALEWLLKTIDHPDSKAVAVYGVPGCIAGDAETFIKRGNRTGGRTYSLEQIYNKFNGIHTAQRFTSNPYKGKGCIWDNSYDTFIPAWIGDRVGYHKINEVIYSGISDVFKVTTESGMSIKTTKDHPFMVVDGGDEESFLPLSEIKPNDYIYLRQTEMSNGGKKYTYRTEVSTRFHPFGRKRLINGSYYRFIRRSRAVLEASLNNMSLEEFIACLKNEENNLEFLPNNIFIHHKDNIPSNDEISNLQIFKSIQEHNKVHPGLSINFGIQNIKQEKVITIEHVGEEKVFDVKMEDPFHNMVLNNFVVHNCGKSLTGKVVANESKRPCLFADLNAARGGIQGETETNISTMFKTAKALGRPFIILDEFDKAISGSTASYTDGGTGQRIVQKFLIEWEEQSANGPFWYLTLNSLDEFTTISGGALLRRMDIMFFVDLPSEEECRNISKIWSNNYNVIIPSDYDFSGFSGADIAKLTRNMHMLECDVDKAREYLKTANESIATQITNIRAKGKNVCMWASDKQRKVVEQTIAKRKVSLGWSTKQDAEVTATGL